MARSIQQALIEWLFSEKSISNNEIVKATSLDKSMVSRYRRHILNVKNMTLSQANTVSKFARQQFDNALAEVATDLLLNLHMHSKVLNTQVLTITEVVQELCRYINLHNNNVNDGELFHYNNQRDAVIALSEIATFFLDEESNRVLVLNTQDHDTFIGHFTHNGLIALVDDSLFNGYTWDPGIKNSLLDAIEKIPVL